MKKTLLLSILFFAFLSAFLPQVTSAQISTITFNELAHNQALGKSYTNSGFTFSVNVPSASSAQIISRQNSGFEGSMAITDNNFAVGGITRWTIERSNGEAFQFRSIFLQDGGFGSSTSGTIQGFKNGSSTGPAKAIQFNSATAGLKDYAGDPDFFDVDEIRIEAADINFNLDHFTHGPPFTPVDTDPAEVTSISLTGAPASNATSVVFSVNFNKTALNVSTDDFQLTTTGTVVGTVSSVSGSGSTYLVTVTGISGDGSLRLDLRSGTNISNANGNTGTPAFTSGQLHYVSPCFIETFEDETIGSKTFTGNGLSFSLLGNWEVSQETPFSGIGGSQKHLTNTGEGPYSITSNELITMKQLALYLSSNPSGTNPTNDGTVTIKGFNDGVEQFSLTKSSGFPTDGSSNSGYFFIDFATEQGQNNTNKRIDRLEISLGGSFVYLNLDNFEWCEAEPTFFTRNSGGNWNSPNTWSAEGCDGAASASVPETTDLVTICTDDVVLISDLQSISELTIQGSLEILSGGVLTTNNQVELEGGSLTVRSGGLFNNQSGTPIQITAERELLGFDGTNPSNGEGWRYLSSPVSTTLQNLLSNIWTQGHGVIGADAPVGDRHIYRWGESDWIPVMDLTEGITPGRGYLVYVWADDNYDGTPNGNKLLEVVGTEFGDVSVPSNPAIGTGDFVGWSSLGNPYPTSVSYQSIFDETQELNLLTDAIYVWAPNTTDGDGGTPPEGGGSWFTWSLDAGGIGDLTDGLIAPFQGFFVQNSPDPDPLSGPNINFNNEVKSSQTGESFLNVEPRNSVRLQLAGLGLSNSSWLRFSEVGRIDERTIGDAWQLQPLSDHYAMLASVKESGDYFDIGHFPSNLSGIEIPLAMQVTRSGEYTLKVTDFDMVEGSSLFLTDLQTGQSMPLDERFSYTFTISNTVGLFSEPTDPFAYINRKSLKADNVGQYRFIITNQVATGIDPTELPTELTLDQNYPNPFNPTTQISFALPESGDVRLEVFNMLGQRVGVLANEFLQAGRHNVTFDASSLSSGVYVYRLQTGSTILTKKMTLIK